MIPLLRICFHGIIQVLNVYIGDRIESDDKAGLGNLARYIIRACFSQERMVYVPAKNLMMELPKLFIHPRIKNPKSVYCFGLACQVGNTYSQQI